jgi:hypothetical protein
MIDRHIGIHGSMRCVFVLSVRGKARLVVPMSLAVARIVRRAGRGRYGSSG